MTDSPRDAGTNATSDAGTVGTELDRDIGFVGAAAVRSVASESVVARRADLPVRTWSLQFDLGQEVPEVATGV